MPAEGRFSRPWRLYPGVVVQLQTFEQLGEKRSALDMLPRLFEQGGSWNLCAAREFCGRDIDVDADAKDDIPLTGLAEDARDLSAGDEDVVRLLDRGCESCGRADRLRAGLRGRDRELREMLGRHRRPEQDRAEDARSRRREPAPAQSPATFGLLVGDGDRSLCVSGTDEPLRGRAPFDIAVLTPEASPEERLDDLRRERVRHPQLH
jgi:hypothetical protein